MSLKTISLIICLFVLVGTENTWAQKTQKPVLHGKHWVAITGKPLGATAGSMMFQKGGNAVDAACAMLAATCTMWDVLSWGGETQALIYNPNTGKVIGINFFLNDDLFSEVLHLNFSGKKKCLIRLVTDRSLPLPRAPPADC